MSNLGVIQAEFHNDCVDPRKCKWKNLSALAKQRFKVPFCFESLRWYIIILSLKETVVWYSGDPCAVCLPLCLLLLVAIAVAVLLTAWFLCSCPACRQLRVRLRLQAGKAQHRPLLTLPVSTRCAAVALRHSLACPSTAALIRWQLFYGTAGQWPECGVRCPWCWIPLIVSRLWASLYFTLLHFLSTFPPFTLYYHHHHHCY